MKRYSECRLIEYTEGEPKWEYKYDKNTREMLSMTEVERQRRRAEAAAAAVVATQQRAAEAAERQQRRDEQELVKLLEAEEDADRLTSLRDARARITVETPLQEVGTAGLDFPYVIGLARYGQFVKTAVVEWKKRRHNRRVRRAQVDDVELLEPIEEGEIYAVTHDFKEQQEFEFLNIEVTQGPLTLTRVQTDGYGRKCKKGTEVVYGNFLEPVDEEFTPGHYWTDVRECLRASTVAQCASYVPYCIPVRWLCMQGRRRSFL
jgi:hypothetical protein